MNILNLGQSHRLVTKEDAVFFHAHKILGVACLLNFIYRIFLIHTTGNAGITESYWTPTWIGIHSLLHLTSFQFHLSTNRNRKYNIFWPEMRWHTMIFSFRSLITMTMVWLSMASHISYKFQEYSRGAIVLMTIYAADIVTEYYKNDNTTMRDMPYPDYIPKWFIKIHNYFYSITQVLATMIILSQKDIDRIFLILLPIQTAPFGMTLVKKGITDQAGWHISYTAALLINYIYSCKDRIFPVPVYWACTFIFSILRFKYHINKYLLWTAISILQICYVAGIIPSS
jgi:hypothetical protein